MIIAWMDDNSGVYRDISEREGVLAVWSLEGIREALGWALQGRCELKLLNGYSVARVASMHGVIKILLDGGQHWIPVHERFPVCVHFYEGSYERGNRR